MFGREEVIWHRGILAGGRMKSLVECSVFCLFDWRCVSVAVKHVASRNGALKYLYLCIPASEC